MAKLKTRLLIVVEGSKPRGVVTEGDVSRAVAKGLDVTKIPIKSVMWKPLILATTGARVREAAKDMATSNIKKLPVVDDEKLIEIVTQTDIIRSSFDLITALKEMVRARYRPPDLSALGV